MSTTTPNLNLIQPAPAESGILTTYKTNNTAIDNAYGQYINDYEQSLENVAPIEGSTASKNYTVGQYLVKDGGLYKVTSAIASGENIVVGTNVTATSLNDAVVELNTAVATLQDSVTIHTDIKTLTTNNYGNVALGLSVGKGIVLSVRRTGSYGHNMIPFINSDYWYAYAVKNIAGTSITLEPSGTEITVEICYISKS